MLESRAGNKGGEDGRTEERNRSGKQKASGRVHSKDRRMDREKRQGTLDGRRGRKGRKEGRLGSCRLGWETGKKEGWPHLPLLGLVPHSPFPCVLSMERQVCS